MTAPAPDGLLKLAACPFCGGQPASCLFEEGDGFWFNCSCGVTTVERRTEAEAVEHWNTRASAQRPTGGEVDHSVDAGNVIKILRARAVERRQRDINAVGSENTAPIGGYFDWQVAGLVERLAAPSETGRGQSEVLTKSAHSPDECGRECQYYDYFEMLWNWFADDIRHGAEEMRANMPDGLSADDFKAMLDEHESTLASRPAGATEREVVDIPSGAWRSVRYEVYESAKAEGKKVDWIEGTGYVVYDQQALDETRAALPVSSRSASGAEGLPKPAKPEPTRWPAKGDRMKFLGVNGYPFELEAAKKIFTAGNIYRVHACNVESWSHSIQFDDVKGWFNGVMFERVAEPEYHAGEGVSVPSASRGTEA